MPSAAVAVMTTVDGRRGIAADHDISSGHRGIGSLLIGFRLQAQAYGKLMPTQHLARGDRGHRACRGASAHPGGHTATTAAAASTDSAAPGPRGPFRNLKRHDVADRRNGDDLSRVADA